MRSGEFAQLCATTKNTLLHYDELGILRPSQRETNGYRSYTLDDYMTFVIVRAFVQAGFSLKQIAQLVQDRDTDALAQAATENLVAIEAQRAALDRSALLLREIRRQARAAEDFKPDTVRLAKREERSLLIVRQRCLLRPGDSLAQLYRDDISAMDQLRKLGPAAEISPYGLSAVRDDTGQPLYDQLFYELAPGTRRPKHAEVEVLATGTYLEADFEGSWESVGTAYDNLTAFATQKGLPQPTRFYEIAQMRLLDTDPANYRCRISAQISQPQ